MARTLGVTIPLATAWTERSWGIGEIGDLPALGEWLASAGASLVQLLPLGEIPSAETSPYSALTAFAIDPIHLSIEAIPHLPPGGALAALGDDGRARLAAARASGRVQHAAVRELKLRALRAAFDAFEARHLKSGGIARDTFRDFVAREGEWLDDFALFRALRDEHREQAWWEWAAPLRGRDRAALAAARGRLSREVLFHAYCQWLAETQWLDAHARLRARGIELMGDLPFVVGRDSADVWAHQLEFRDEAGVGAPPDQFDEQGQDWGLPPYRWNVMAETGFAWHRARAKRAARLFDRFRIDHLVGFYRTYMRLHTQRVDERGRLRPGFFDPATEPQQLAHGERVIGAMLEAARACGARLVAEDLGDIPNYVRPSLAKLGVPGYKVLIWERDGNVWRDPKGYPELSVACFGTHDTAPVSVWWRSLAPHEREAVRDLPGLRARGLGDDFDANVRRALLDLILGSSSELVLLLVQELLGVDDRVNVPGTIGAHNWSWRLPRSIEALAADPAARDALGVVKEAARASGRS